MDAPFYDRFGFAVDFTQFTQKDYFDFQSDYAEIREARRCHWKDFLDSQKVPDKSKSTKHSLRKGIPHALRPHAWFTYSGAKNLQAAHAGLYTHLIFREGQDRQQNFVKDNEIFEFIRAIEMDLYRTFPDNIRFAHCPKVAGVSRTSISAIVPDVTHSPSVCDLYQGDPPSQDRTMSTLFQEETNQYLLSLRRVLVAFAYYSWPHEIKQELPKACSYHIGYCQGLNMLVGLLLLVYASPTKETQARFESGEEETVLELEEKVFWTLTAIIEVLLPPEVYGNNLEGSQVQQHILWNCIFEERGRHFGLEELAEWIRKAQHSSVVGAGRGRRKTVHLDHLEMFVRRQNSDNLLGMVTTPWFLTVFVEIAPIETTLRIWDSFMYEGEKVLFRVALTIIQMNQVELLQCSDLMDIWRKLRDLPKKLFDCEDFMDLCFQELPQEPTSFYSFFGYQSKPQSQPRSRLLVLDPFKETPKNHKFKLVNSKMIQKLRATVVEERHLDNELRRSTNK
ncbi:hypothetical protein HDU91_004276 [Kappamyces sp. JEL0680]|nr:hypothetical protein HDU91_004276 [Kappamyces sp. JEL0680]